jgi:hypothetical protein
VWRNIGLASLLATVAFAPTVPVGASPDDLADAARSPICARPSPAVVSPEPTFREQSPAKMYAFTAKYPTIVAILEKRDYPRAARLLRTYDDYRDGVSTTAYPSRDPLFFGGRFLDSFAQLYKDDFCGHFTELNPHASEGNAARLFARALQAAVSGKYATARDLARLTTLDTPDFVEGTLLAGQIDIALHDSQAAHDDWLRTARHRGFACPDCGASGPDAQHLAAVQYLLHFRP